MSDSNRCVNCAQPFPAGVTDCPGCTTQTFSAQGSAPGTPRIAGYRVLERVGEGGMGSVYVAEETALGRKVAIKLIAVKLAADDQIRARFMREARSLAKIEHPNVVRVYAFGEHEGQPYLAMEYVVGETLSEKLQRSGPLSIEESVRIMRQILLALDAAWEQGIVHRDIKPSNILIDRRGDVHVADFGLAKALDVKEDMALTQTGHVLGTPYYVAPEQAQGKPADFRADIYSCGILLYEMLAGERPFEGTTPFTIVAKHLSEPIPDLRKKRSDVPERIAGLVKQMTEKSPESRAGSYSELIARFDAFLGLTPGRSVPRTEAFATVPIRSVSRYRLPLLVALLIIGVSLVALQLRTKKSSAGRTSRPDPRLVVAVAPFYGPDDESVKEGRVMASLVERSIVSRLGSENVRVVGIDESKQAVRSHEAARELGARLSSSIVVWGEAVSLQGETEIQPSFTIVQKAPQPKNVSTHDESSRARVDPERNDLEALAEQRTGMIKLESKAPNQIELRKTTAEGVGQMVSFLAAVYALYYDSNPKQAIGFLDQAPRTVEALRIRSQAQLQQNDKSAALKSLEDAAILEPAHTETRARLGDLYVLVGRPLDAVREYRAASSSGKPFVTHYGIVAGDVFYIREVFSFRDYAPDEFADTGYLLALSASTGVVERRYRLPGAIRSLAPGSGDVRVTFAADKNETQLVTLTLRGGEFDRPLFPGGNLLLRMRGMKSAWVLPRNFMQEFLGVTEKQIAQPRFQTTADIAEGTPRTLPDLEIALRTAIRQDPTQPWHLYWLGHALSAQGRSAEAAQVWGELVRRPFAVPFYEYNMMTKFSERLGHREWADRIYEKGRRERMRSPQPVLFTTLIERLISQPFVRLHPEQTKDAERAYTWLVRARESSGPTEADNYAATAWAEYFENRGDTARAANERKYAALAARHPFNMTSLASRADYAIYFFFATLFGLIVSSVILVSRATVEKSAAPAGRRFAIVATVLALCLIAAAGVYVFLTGEIDIAVGIALACAALVLAFSLLRSKREAVARISLKERFALALSFTAFLVAAVLLSRSFTIIGGASRHPLGMADSLGHPEIVFDLNARLPETKSRDLTYVAAVANHLGGELDRARKLYEQMPEDPRSRKALEAIRSKRIEVTMPAPGELFGAYVPGTKWNLAIDDGDFGLPNADNVLRLSGLVGILFGLILLICFFLIRPVPSNPFVSRPATRIGRAVSFAIPGTFDLRHGSALAGIIVTTLLGFAIIFVLICFGKSWWILRSPGLLTAIALPNIYSSSPFPPGANTSADTSDVMFAPISSNIFWPFAFGALAFLLVFHAVRVRQMIRFFRQPDIENAPTQRILTPIANHRRE